jgi:hypothetical protein
MVILGLTRLSLDPSKHLIRGLPKQGAVGALCFSNLLDGLAA